jgi:hypothetical protein
VVAVLPSPKAQLYDTTGVGNPLDRAVKVTVRSPSAGLMEISARASSWAAAGLAGTEANATPPATTNPAAISSRENLTTRPRIRVSLRRDDPLAAFDHKFL